MELFNEVFTKQTLSWKEFFQIVYGVGLSETGAFQLHDFGLYSEGARREFILKLAADDVEVLDEFLRSVYMAILIGASFASDNKFEDKPRQVLLKELLLWAQWGVDVRNLPIYQIAFALIYYNEIDVYGFGFESYQCYDEEYRADVIHGLCANGLTNVLEVFVLNSRCDENMNSACYAQKWKKVGVPRHVSLLFELSNWCDWGADIPCVVTALFDILLGYVDKQDFRGFINAFVIVYPYLNPDMKQNLQLSVLQKKFCKQDVREQFVNAIGGYTM